jgi:hypothetical protein
LKNDSGSPDALLQAKLTAEMIIDALLDDPDIISAEYLNGEFYVVTTAGSKSFRISFKEENGAGTA